jgi:hypothetical protein
VRIALNAAVAQPASAQRFLSSIPNLTEVKGEIVKTLDTLIDAANAQLAHRDWIPDQ